MLIHSIVESSRVNGPGIRAVVWFQGCTLACSGCWNKDTHSFSKSAGIEIGVEELAQKIAALPNLDGVTFSGGEPLQQAPELLMLMRRQRRRHLGRQSPFLSASEAAPTDAAGNGRKF